MAEEYDPAFPTGDDDDDASCNVAAAAMSSFHLDEEPPQVEGEEIVVSMEGDVICDEEMGCNLTNSFIVGSQETVISSFSGDEADDTQYELRLESEDGNSDASPARAEDVQSVAFSTCTEDVHSADVSSENTKDAHQPTVLSACAEDVHSADVSSENAKDAHEPTVSSADAEDVLSVDASLPCTEDADSVDQSRTSCMIERLEDIPLPPEVENVKQPAAIELEEQSVENEPSKSSSLLNRENEKLSDFDSESNFNYSSDSSANEINNKMNNCVRALNFVNDDYKTKLQTPLLERLRNCLQESQASNLSENSSSFDSFDMKQLQEIASTDISEKVSEESKNSSLDGSQKVTNENDSSSSTIEESQSSSGTGDKGKRKKGAKTKAEDSSTDGKGPLVRRRSSRIKSLEEKKEREREEREREERERYERECEEKGKTLPKEDEKNSHKVEVKDDADCPMDNDDKQTPEVDPQPPQSPKLTPPTEPKPEEISTPEKEAPATVGLPQQDDFSSPKPEKVKSRWRRSSEMERGEYTPSFCRNLNEEKWVPVNSNSSTPVSMSNGEKTDTTDSQLDSESSQDSRSQSESKVAEAPKCPGFETIHENIYLTERRKSKSKKEVKRMVCDCTITKEELARDVVACGEDCLNRLLMIECGSRCPTGEYCTNMRFQKRQYADVVPFKTELKGWGLKTNEDLSEGAFIMEYVGEVLDPREFKRRVKEYAREKCQHYYFMALRSDEIIDATRMGNVSRFINHSCSPNCETQKWTVNGELRIGFFTRTSVHASEELTFDYQFQRYGKEAQKCYCMSENCRGYIGGDKQTPLKRERSAVPKRRKTAEEKKRDFLDDMDLTEEIEKLSVNGGLRNRDQTLTLSRLMIRAEDIESRLGLLRILQKTTEQACLRLFLDYHGLSLVWSWMVDVTNSDDAIELKTQILQTLSILPITNKTMLMDSRVLAVVQRWSQQIEEAQQDKEKDSEVVSSELASQVSTPTNVEGSEKSLEVVQKAADQLQIVAEDSCSSTSEETGDEHSRVQVNLNQNKEVKHECHEMIEAAYKVNGGNDVKMIDATVFEVDLNDICLPPGSPPVMNACTAAAECTKECASVEESVSQCVVKEEAIKEPETTSLESNMSTDSPLVCSVSLPAEGVVKMEVDSDAKDDVDMTNAELASESCIAFKADKTRLDDTESMATRPASEIKEESEDSILRSVEETVHSIQDFVNKAVLVDDGDISRWKLPEGSEEEPKSPDEAQKENKSSDTGLMDTQESNIANTEVNDKGSEDVEMKADVEEGVTKEKEMASLASKLLDSWSSLKEAYRIPKREQNQTRREHEREADRHLHELRQSNCDSPSQYSENDDRKDRWDSRYDRDNDRKHGRNSPDREYRHDKRSRMDDDSSPDGRRRRSRHSRMSHGMLPPHLRLSKQERRHLFEMKVQQEEAEEAIRKQHEEFMRQQHEQAMLMEPAPVFYDPNFPPHPLPHPPHPLPHPHANPHPSPAFFDPNTGTYLPPPIALSAPVDGGPPIMEPPPFEPAFDPTQPPVVYPPPPGVVYPGQPPPFLPPPGVPPPGIPPPGIPPPGVPPPTVAPAAPPPASPVQPTPPGTHYIAPVVPSPTQPVFYPSQAPPPTVIQLPDQTAVVPPWSQTQLVSLIEEAPPPSEPPVKSKPPKLPPNWKATKDPEGRIYYYHSITRQTQWEPPTADQVEETEMEEVGTPTFDEPKVRKRNKLKNKKKQTTTAAADTSSELVKRTKELFRTKMSQFIVQCLNPYRKPDCKVGRISSTEDFKHLARKLTHFVMAKELKYCRNIEDLECNDNVKHKAKDFVKKYMAKFGSTYRKAASPKDE